MKKKRRQATATVSKLLADFSPRLVKLAGWKKDPVLISEKKELHLL